MPRPLRSLTLICSKELRDIFEDIVDKIVQPLKAQGLQPDDLRIIIEEVVQTFPDRSLDVEHHARYVPVFHRFFTALSAVVRQLY